MRKLYQEFFYIPKYGKIREKVMVARAVLTVTVIVACLAAMGFTAYGYFSHGMASDINSIKAASFSLEVSVSVAGSEQELLRVERVDGITHTAALEPGKTYRVKLTRSGNASTGFCVVSAENCSIEKYHTQQLGVDVNAASDENDTLVFYLEVTSPTVVTFCANWGTSVYYDPLGQMPETEEIYIRAEETVVLPITAPAEPQDGQAGEQTATNPPETGGEQRTE